MIQCKINFDGYKNSESENIKALMRLRVFMFYFLKKLKLLILFRKSRLLYIGISERKTNSIAKDC